MTCGSRRVPKPITCLKGIILFRFSPSFLLLGPCLNRRPKAVGLSARSRRRSA